MVWEVNGKPYHFDKDFKELHAKQRISIVKMVRNLLKIQKEEQSVLADVSANPPAGNATVTVTESSTIYRNQKGRPSRWKKRA